MKRNQLQWPHHYTLRHLHSEIVAMAAATSLASCNANAAPMQVRGPARNGRLASRSISSCAPAGSGWPRTRPGDPGRARRLDRCAAGPCRSMPPRKRLCPNQDPSGTLHGTKQSGSELIRAGLPGMALIANDSSGTTAQMRRISRNFSMRTLTLAAAALIAGMSLAFAQHQPEGAHGNTGTHQSTAFTSEHGSMIRQHATGQHYQSFTDHGFQAQVGAILPGAAPLHPLPDGVVTQMPSARNHQYSIVNDRYVIVDPSTRRITHAFE